MAQVVEGHEHVAHHQRHVGRAELVGVAAPRRWAPRSGRGRTRTSRPLRRRTEAGRRPGRACSGPARARPARRGLHRRPGSSGSPTAGGSPGTTSARSAAPARRTRAGTTGRRRAASGRRTPASRCPPRRCGAAARACARARAHAPRPGDGITLLAGSARRRRRAGSGCVRPSAPRGGRARRRPPRPGARRDSFCAASCHFARFLPHLCADVFRAGEEGRPCSSRPGRRSFGSSIVRSSAASASPALQLHLPAVEARALAGVARGAGGIDERDQRVLVAVVAERPHAHRVAGGLPLAPQLAARAAPEVHLARLPRAREGLLVHVGEREHLAGARVLHHARHEALVVEADLVHSWSVARGRTWAARAFKGMVIQKRDEESRK